jgi:hypothetical protein
MPRKKPVSFHERFAGWRAIEETLERGDHPEATDIAEKLRSRPIEGLPDLVRLHIAGLLDGSIRPKRGRKKQNRFRDAATNIAVEHRYWELLEHYQTNPPKDMTPRDAALRETADKFHRSVDWVVDRVYPGRLFREK